MRAIRWRISLYSAPASHGFGSDNRDAKTFPWDHCEIWHATSEDGWQWREEGLAIPRGATGAYDDGSVFTPEIRADGGKYCLYYKGEPMGERMFFGGREAKWGVAIVDRPEGPYVRSPYNPVTNSGHEVCVWPYRDGVAALITTDGS